MTPKRRAAINLSWFFFMPLLQQIPADQMFSHLLYRLSETNFTFRGR